MDETKSSNEEALDRVVAWVCTGLDDAQLGRHIRQKIDDTLDDGAVAELITQARAAIADRVAYDRDFHIGRAISRLDQLYSLAIAQQDVRSALAAQKELSRLLDLTA